MVKRIFVESDSDQDDVDIFGEKCASKEQLFPIQSRFYFSFW
jgi:hypothetical protein